MLRNQYRKRLRTIVGDGVFFSFTAIPGEGYRTLRAGTPVSFELVENKTGPTARNVQKDGES